MSVVRPLFASILILLAASGCGEPEADPAALKAASMFRYNARRVYAALLTESCIPTPELSRARVLAAEMEGIRRFEGKAGSGPLRFQLDVARSDVDLARRTLGGCFEDSDPRLARIHIAKARDQARIGLNHLSKLAPGLQSLPSSPSEIPAADGAKFRSLARELIEMVEPRCEIDPEVDNGRIVAPARAELQRFRKRLTGSPWAVHFEMVEADSAYVRSVTMVDCREPRPGAARETGRYMLEKNRITISRLREIAGV